MALVLNNKGIEMSGFPTYGDTSFPDYIEHSALTTGIGGSLSSTGSLSYDSDGAAVGTGTLSWPNAFVSSNNLANGFSLSFEIEKRAFKYTNNSQTQDWGVFSIGGTNPVIVERDQATQAWNVLSNGSPTYVGYRSRDTEYDDHVRVDISYDPSGNGNIKAWVNYYPFIDQDLTAKPSFDGDIFLGGDGTIANIVERFRNVQIVKAPLDFSDVNKYTIAHMGDSWHASYGQYELGTSDSVPVLQGYTGTEDGGEYEAPSSYKNTSYVAMLTKNLIEQGIYPSGAGDKIGFYGRNGGQMGNQGSKPYSQRIDACLQSTTATGPAFPVSGQGTNNTEIFVTHIGTNSVQGKSNAQMDAEFADFQGSIDRLIDNGCRYVIIDQVAARWTEDAVPVLAEVTETAYMNGLIATLEGYRGVCYVNTGIFTEFAADSDLAVGVHPSRKGQVVWAQTVSDTIQRAFAESLTYIGSKDNAGASDNAIQVSKLQASNSGSIAPLVIDKKYKVVRYGFYGRSDTTTAKSLQIGIYDHDGNPSNRPQGKVAQGTIDFASTSDVGYHYAADGVTEISPSDFPNGHAVLAASAIDATVRVYRRSSQSGSFVETGGSYNPLPSTFPTGASSDTKNVIIFVELAEVDDAGSPPSSQLTEGELAYLAAWEAGVVYSLFGGLNSDNLRLINTRFFNNDFRYELTGNYINWDHELENYNYIQEWKTLTKPAGRDFGTIRIDDNGLLRGNYIHTDYPEDD